jgi:2-oxoglutarate dehydrogenase E2 component (dihydrolipoamide succinyltransferase)
MARITMPQLGETVTEGTITRWLKSAGDHVATDEPLLEVSTDKVETEIPSAHAGVVTRIVVPEGDTVPIGALLCVIGDEDAAPTGDGADHSVGGWSPGSRSFRRSLEGGLGSTQRPVRHTSLRAAPGVRHEPARGSAPAPSPLGSAAPIDMSDVAERIPFGVIRRRTAEHMVASVHTAAHTLVVVEVDYSAVEAARSAHQARWRAQLGFGLSYLPFVARAVCDGLVSFPHLNASVDEVGLVVHRHVNLGIAVDLDHDGLMVPVVRSADSYRLPELAQRGVELAARARARTLGGDDISGGTFTITNAGGLGTFVTAPIINPPQVAIVSTDGVAPRPVALALPGGGHGVAVRPVGNVGMSFDHRAVDGAYAAAFLANVKATLEQRCWDDELAALGGEP